MSGGIGRSAFGLAGTIVGSYFGPVGGAIGGMVGSAIGGALFPPDPVKVTQQIGDLKVPGTEYGQSIPYIIGAQRIAPQIWWNSDKRAIPHTETSGGGGKGGSEPSAEQTTYTYEIDILYGLCDQEIVGVTRIWDSGKLIYRNESGASAGTIGASLNSEDWTRLTIYTGASTQQPDDTYATAVGATNAPAYRGRGTVFIEGLNLGASGSLRNLTFEVVIDGSSGTAIEYFDLDYSNTALTYNASVYIPETEEVWTVDAGFNPSPAGTRIGIFDTVARTTSFLYVPTGFDYCTASWIPPIRYLAESGIVLVSVAVIGVGNATTLAFNATTREYLGNWASYVGWSTPICVGVDETNHTALIVREGNSYQLWSLDPLTMFPYAMLQTHAHGGGNLGFNTSYADDTGVYYCQCYSRIGKYGPAGVLPDVALDADGANTGNYDSLELQLCMMDTTRNRFLYWSGGLGVAGRLKYVDCDTDEIGTVGDYVGESWYGGRMVYESASDKYYILQGGAGSGFSVAEIDPDTGDFTEYPIPDTGGNHFGGPTMGYSQGVIWCASAQWDGPTTSSGVGEIVFNQFSKTCPTVAQAVSRLCLRAGLTADQIDVTSLSSITRSCCSLVVSQVAAMRQPLELLMSAYYFEMTISDKLYFIVRGSAPQYAFTFEELGASIGGGAKEPLALRAGNDIEIPAQIGLTYINLSNDYQSDMQPSDRLVSAVNQTLTPVQMALGMTPSEAKAVVNTMLRDQVASALFSTTISVLGTPHALLEPTDVVTITGPDGSVYRMRIVEATDTYPVQTLKLITDDATVLSEQGITSTDYTSSTTVAGPVATRYVLLDIPILRDADNAAGMYVACKGADTPWPGAVFYRSLNNVTYESVATATTSAVYGTCSTVLGDWTGSRIIDELNSVTVNVGATGVLTSSTRDIVLNDSSVNAFLIGDEIVQAITATFVSTGVYTLSRLLRGCRGTEWAMTGHAAFEQCAHLTSAALRRVALANSDIGIAEWYKAVTLGRPLGTATGAQFTCEAVGLKPFAPIDARSNLDASNNFNLEWSRRSRLAVRMIGTVGISVPLGEETELWDVTYYTDSTYATIATAVQTSTTSHQLTSTAQTTAGLTPGSLVFYDIEQRSGVVGKGYRLRGYGPVRSGDFFNPSDKTAGMLLSNGYSTAGGDNVAGTAVRGMRAVTTADGLYYWEVKIDSGGGAACWVGLQPSTDDLISFGSIAAWRGNGNFYNGTWTTGSGTVSSVTAGDVMMWALNCATGKLWAGLNGTWLGSGNPAAGTLPGWTNMPAGNWHVWFYTDFSQVTLRATIDDFSYTPPAGFLPLHR